MSRIRGKNTKPEHVVRSLLHRMGYRFRLHCTRLPGTPDIVLPKFRTVVFVHGCFWHRHGGCKYAYETKSRKGFWREKFRENVNRDRKHIKALGELGWRVLVVWECEVNTDPLSAVQRIADQLAGSTGVSKRVVYELPTHAELMKVAESKLHAGLAGSGNKRDMQTKRDL